jgi:hypothetical protein
MRGVGPPLYRRRSPHRGPARVRAGHALARDRLQPWPSGALGAAPATPRRGLPDALGWVQPRARGHWEGATPALGRRALGRGPGYGGYGEADAAWAWRDAASASL